MGFFFFIAGYFTPGTLDRKGPCSFIIDRLLRLGIPWFLFSFLVRPSIIYIMNVNTLGIKYSFTENILQMKNVAPGPMWFLETLLVFSVGYMLWNLLLPDSDSKKKETGKIPGDLSIMTAGLLIMFLTFVVRTFYPVGSRFLHFQLGNFPQYITLFAGGIVAYRLKWPLIIAADRGLKWIAAAVILLLLLTVAMLANSDVARPGTAFAGGFAWQSLLLSAWESFYCISMVMGLLFLFGNWFNHQGKLARALSADAYAVYIVHTPLIVFLSYAMNDITLNPLLKFMLVSLTGVPLCFLVSHYLLKKIPRSSKIL